MTKVGFQGSDEARLPTTPTLHKRRGRRRVTGKEPPSTESGVLCGKLGAPAPLLPEQRDLPAREIDKSA